MRYWVLGSVFCPFGFWPPVVLFWWTMIGFVVCMSDQKAMLLRATPRLWGCCQVWASWVCCVPLLKPGCEGETEERERELRTDPAVVSFVRFLETVPSQDLPVVLAVITEGLFPAGTSGWFSAGSPDPDPLVSPSAAASHIFEGWQCHWVSFPTGWSHGSGSSTRLVWRCSPNGRMGTRNDPDFCVQRSLWDGEGYVE